MKNKLLWGCMCVASMLATGCSDMLDEDPKGKLTPETYFSTQDELDMSVYALYSKVNASQAYTNMQYPQWQGDDITTNPGSNKQAAAELDKFAPLNSNKGVKDAWSSHYLIVKAANFIIMNAAKTPTSEEEINIAIGQAKFWRAYAYFYLVRLFGPIPVNLDNVNDDYTAPLTPVEEVYNLIVQDLKDAENLPAGYEDSPRKLFNVDVYVTRQAVKSTLAAVYMAMAGWPLNKTEYYAQAAAKAKEVIDGVNGGLYDITMDAEWKDVYSMGNNYNKETILGINYSPIVDWAQDSQLTSCNQFESLGGWGDAWGEIRFWKAFPEGPRKDAVYSPQVLLPDGSLVDWWATYEDGSPMVPEFHPLFSVFSVNWDPATKVNIAAPYDYRLPASQKMTNDHRHRLIRYPEVLLWYAESLARSGQVDDLARQCLKQVRSRAVNPEEVDVVDGVSIDAMTPDQMAEAAYDEHGWEVAGYWVALVPRRADQFRMNRLKDTFEERVQNLPVEIVPGVQATESVEFTNTVWNDNLMYLPYPDTDADKNPNLVR